MHAGSDKKTTLLDYVVKNLYDKGESSVLSIIEDLSIVLPITKISSIEILREIDSMEKNLRYLEEEHQRHLQKLQTAGGSQGNPLGSPTSKNLASQFSMKLESILIHFRQLFHGVIEDRSLLTSKSKEICLYFCEDPSKCDTMSIFSVLQQFRYELLCSRDKFERLRAKQS